jgi:hypothetical protein
MPNLVDVNKDPYGLSAGTIITGGVTQSCDAFTFYPVDNCYTVKISFANLANGPLTLATASLGLPIYGQITSVQMAGGTAILYSGSYQQQ